jgi:hypothetical protein
MQERTRKVKFLPDEIGENFMRVTDRQRVVTSAFDKMKFAIREARGDLLREPKGEGAIFFSVPKPNRHPHFFQRESPWLRIDVGIDHHARGG